MNGKTSFAIDYLNVLCLMNAQAKEGMNIVSHAACLIFLVDWGLNSVEIEEANKLFLGQMDNPSDDYPIINKRIIASLQNREEDKKRLMRQLATIVALDDDLTQNEGSLYQEWGKMLDFKPSEIETLYDFGIHWAVGLRYFGSRFHEQMKRLPQT
jgi:hypothetical protein